MTQPTNSPSPAEFLRTRVRVPQSVVFRSFPTETVVLNLTTGRYHGLNPSAGKMLEAMTMAMDLRSAADQVAGEYGYERERVEADICDLCRSLLERGLLEIENEDEAA